MTVHQTWTELVSRNPMLIEITRFRRKFLTMNGSNTLSGVIIGMITVTYLGIVGLIFNFRDSVDPVLLVCAQAVLMTVIAPTLLHSSIAGERERRSWDLLLAAPITKGQIVVGKFIGALSAIGAGTAAFVFPIGVCALSYPRVHFWNLMLTEAVCLSFVTLVCSISLFFSARVKRSFMALGATLGVLAFGLIAFPALLEVLTGFGTGGSHNYFDDTLLYLHPGFVIERIWSAGSPFSVDYALNVRWYGLPQILVYLGLSGVILGWTINTLNFAENEVKFMPKGKA